MAVLVLSKGNTTEKSYKPFDLNIDSYTGCGYTESQEKPDMKTTLLEKYAASSQTATSIPQLFIRQSFLIPSTHRGILKKKPEGTVEIAKPHKQVSFADTMGRELTQVKEIPNLSVFEQRVEEDFNLSISPSEKIPKQSISPVPTLKRIVNKNKWSYAKHDCIEKMHENMVALQEIKLENSIFQGKVRVLNINYDKAITIRWTVDAWKSYFNISAKYLEEKANKNHNSDIFEFHLPCEHGCIEFAIQYKTGQLEYWDNNEGRNYQIRISQA